MKKLESILLHSCAYTVLIATLFFAIAGIMDVHDAKFGFLDFLLIFLFSVVITFANMVLKYEKLNLLLRFIIHYLALLIVFCIVFFNIGNMTATGAAKVFITVIIFTLLYVIIAIITWLAKKSVKKIDKTIQSKAPKTAKQKSNEYQPRFKN